MFLSLGISKIPIGQSIIYLSAMFIAVKTTTIVKSEGEQFLRYEIFSISLNSWGKR